MISGQTRTAAQLPRMEQHRIASAVGGFHLDILLHHIGLGERRRAGDTGGRDRHQAEAAP